MVISGQDPVTLDDKKQKSVRIPFGSPLSLNCKLQTGGYERFCLSWYFNPSGSSFNETHFLYVRMSNRYAKTSTVMEDDGQDTKEALFNLTLNATDENSGWYFCRVTVEIPNYHVINSSGTEVIISKSVEHTTHLSLPIITATVSPPDHFQPIDWWLWIGLGVSSFVLIVLLITCVLLRRTCRSRAEEPVYINTHAVNKQPSPRPKMPADNLKTGSSSQNIRNPSPSRRCDEGK